MSMACEHGIVGPCAECSVVYAREAGKLLARVVATERERDAARAELATIIAERDGAVSIATQLERESARYRTALHRLCGVLVDAGTVIVPDDPENGHGMVDCVVQIVKERDEARAGAERLREFLRVIIVAPDRFAGCCCGTLAEAALAAVEKGATK